MKIRLPSLTLAPLSLCNVILSERLLCNQTKPGVFPLPIFSAISTSGEGVGTADLTISGNAQWSVDNSASWLQLSKTGGNSGSSTIPLTAGTNGTGATRSIIHRLDNMM